MRTRLIGISLLAATAAALPLDDARGQTAALPTVTEQFLHASATPDAAALWAAMRSQATLEVVTASYAVLQGIDFPGQPTAAQCEAAQAALDQALRDNPVSLALQRAALQCAEARGDEAGADRASLRLEALIAHAGREGAGQSELAAPIEIASEFDAMAFAQSAGLQVVAGRYGLAATARRLPLTLHLDDGKGHERTLHFDFMDAWIAMSREPDMVYPGAWRSSMLGFLDISATSGNRFAQLSMAELSLAHGDAAAARRWLDSSRASGEPLAVVTDAEWCVLAKLEAGCRGDEFDNLLALGEEGFGPALLRLAIATELGRQVGRDTARSAALLAKAESRIGKRDAREQYAHLLARFGEKRMLGRHPAQAALEAAVELGSPISASTLAAGYAAGKLGSAEEAEIIRLLEIGAKAGHTHALFLLGLLHVGNERYAAGADAWQRAAALGHADSAFRLWTLARAKPTESGITRAPRALLRDAAFAGSVNAMQLLATDSDGKYTASEDERQQWLKSAAVYGSTGASVKLAESMLDASDAEQQQSGREMLDQLADAGSPAARTAIAVRALDAARTDAEKQQAIERLEALGAEGVAPALHELGERYEWGHGVAVDLERAAGYYERGAKLDYPQSLDFYAYALKNGRGVRANEAKAEKFWTRAAQLGYSVAINNLAWLLCTTSSKSVRDPLRGSELVRRLVEGRDAESGEFDTAAACAAADARFDDAVAFQQKAIDTLEADADAERRARMEKRLATYRSGKALRLIPIE